MFLFSFPFSRPLRAAPVFVRGSCFLDRTCPHYFFRGNSPPPPPSRKVFFFTVDIATRSPPFGGAFFSVKINCLPRRFRLWKRSRPSLSSKKSLPPKAKVFAWTRFSPVHCSVWSPPLKTDPFFSCKRHHSPCPSFLLHLPLTTLPRKKSVF